MQAAIQAFADVDADVGRSEPDHQQGADALRRHGRHAAATATRATSSRCTSSRPATGHVIAYDTSGVEPARTSRCRATCTGSAAGASTSPAARRRPRRLERKLQDLIKATGEYSIEAWVAPGNVVRKNAHRQLLRRRMTARNFTLGQTMYNYDFFNRSSDQRQRRPAAVDPRRRRGAAGDPAARRR